MYGIKSIKSLNGVNSSVKQEPEQLSVALVSSGTVVGSVSELPVVGLGNVEGFEPFGDSIKVSRVASVTPFDCVDLAGLRQELAKRFESNPNLYYGVTNRGQDWAVVQAFVRS